jgi:hypothetical protein
LILEGDAYMNRLTFKGFLSKYIRQLSHDTTINIKKLTQEAYTINPRLREPLFLYAMYHGKQDALLKEAKRVENDELEHMQNSFFVKVPFPPTLYEEFSELVNKYTADTMTDALKSRSSELKVEYKKVWNSYQCVSNGVDNDRETKEFIRKKVQKLMESKNVTAASLCKELDLDPGNFSAWISKGNNDRISLKSARRVLEHLDI